MEIVNKLVELKLIDVLYTQDGKEYITPQNLSKEIRDELFVHGGKYEDVVLYLIYRYIYIYKNINSYRNWVCLILPLPILLIQLVRVTSKNGSDDTFSL